MQTQVVQVVLTCTTESSTGQGTRVVFTLTFDKQDCMYMYHMQCHYTESGKLSKCCELLANIQEALIPENVAILQQNFPYITAMLENAYLSINSVIMKAKTLSQTDKVMDDNMTNFKQTLCVAPGQKHEKQLRFHRTTQKCGRKRKENILRYSQAGPQNYTFIYVFK